MPICWKMVCAEAEAKRPKRATKDFIAAAELEGYDGLEMDNEIITGGHSMAFISL
jgi:hypothetical protein